MKKKSTSILEQSNDLFKQGNYDECISLLDTKYEINLESPEDHREAVLVFMTVALCFYNKVAKNGVGCISEVDKIALLSAIASFEKVRFYYSSYREALDGGGDDFKSLVSKPSFLDATNSTIKACYLIGKSVLEIHGFDNGVSDENISQGCSSSKAAIKLLKQVMEVEDHVSKDRKVPYELLSQCYLIKGQCESISGDYGDADESLNKFIQELEKSSDGVKKENGLAIGYHHLGNLQALLGNNKSAVEYYAKSIDLCENLMVKDFKQHLVDHVIETRLKRAKVTASLLFHHAEELNGELVREYAETVCDDYEFVIRNKKENSHLYKLKYYRFILMAIDKLFHNIQEDELTHFYERSYSLINDCLEHYENNSKLYHDLAKCTSKIDGEDNLSTALELYDTSIKLMTLNNRELTFPMKKFIASSHFERGVLLILQEGRLEKALEEFNLSLQYSPSFADSLYNRGIVRSQLGQLDAANDDFKKATSYNSHDLEAYRQWFLNLRAQGKKKEAEKVAEHVFEKHSNNSETPLDFYLAKIESGELVIEESKIREL